MRQVRLLRTYVRLVCRAQTRMRARHRLLVCCRRRRRLFARRHLRHEITLRRRLVSLLRRFLWRGFR
jgi:hypothetical protein